MKNVLRLAMIGTALAAGVSVAAAQEGGTGRASYDDPVHYWNNDLVTGPGSDQAIGMASSGYDSAYYGAPGYYSPRGPIYGRRAATPYE